jgi:hypothetical protein
MDLDDLLEDVPDDKQKKTAVKQQEPRNRGMTFGKEPKKEEDDGWGDLGDEPAKTNGGLNRDRAVPSNIGQAPK